MHPTHPFIKLLPHCLLVSVLLLLAQVCHAQDPVKLKPDTTAIQQDTVKQKFDERLMDNLRRMSERKTIMGKLLDAILVFDRKDQEVYGLDAELIQREYEKHNYKIVRRLDIVTLDAFGYSINDSTRVPRNFFEKAGNTLHVKTSRGLVRNQLLFRRNQPLEPLSLVESERLLRQTDYILDARIVVNELTTTDDSVDVFVITKDVFSLGGSGSYSPSSGRGKISLRELNFLGRGHQVRGTYRFNMDRPRPWEASGAYSIESIGRTYVGADLVYTNENYYKEKSAYLQRDFFSTTTKYAGAVGYADIEEKLLLPPVPEDTIPRFGDLKYNRTDVWLGRSFKFKSYHLGYEPRGRLIVGLRMIDTDYSQIPTDNFQNNILMLASVGYSVRKYYKDRYLFGFGRTEDIPAGTLVSFTTGYEKGDVMERRYFAASTSYARYRTETGYFYGSATWGSFLRDDRWEQGVLELETLYFTPLKEWGNWKLRHYVQGRATFGINRNPEELLAINNESGLRGFRSDLLRGSRRVTLNYEANLYTPLSLLGFRLAAVAFTDIAWLSTGNKSSPFKNTPYRGYGIGVRFRNEYLSFSTIQLLISYYPKMHPNEDFDNFRILESSRPYYDFTDFRFTRPGVANFR
ncbi:hypothetical protein ABID22_000658 [Pontibacter aydingkolensis]|uniref:Outer membrane protein assembly factor BamA n=1 Tax=Pontibacter aydingkolensis TaxID=1911536 RepID=A0ABS7CRQ3_9BACT|nr:hypothetical protein [Pontibacter aydingkolensis]MBW7466468.1 hypothetical protein [Pontibacter aydingkolensis]